MVNIRPTRSDIAGSNSQSFLQLADTVACDAQLGFLVVLQPHDDAAVDPRIQLLNERGVDNRRPMNPDKSPRVELLFELCECVVDDVLSPVHDRKRELVLGEQM